MICLQTAFSRALIRGLLLAGTTSLLTGCISLFPKADPAQLYRFGFTAPQVQGTPSEEPGFGVLLAGMGFDPAAAGDRILTVTVSGTQAAYIKGARWVTSAADLFDAALQHAFDADLGPARLVARGDIDQPDYVLKLNVRTFEARYENGQSAAPTIVIEVHAALHRIRDQTIVDERNFKASLAASDNRVSTIVQAFDHAIAQVLHKLVRWVNARGKVS